jgi:hypothetical protein
MIAAIDARTSTDAGNRAPRSASPSPSARALRSEADDADSGPVSARSLRDCGGGDASREEKRCRNTGWLRSGGAGWSVRPSGVNAQDDVGCRRAVVAEPVLAFPWESHFHVVRSVPVRGSPASSRTRPRDRPRAGVRSEALGRAAAVLDHLGDGGVLQPGHEPDPLGRQVAEPVCFESLLVDRPCSGIPEHLDPRFSPVPQSDVRHDAASGTCCPRCCPNNVRRNDKS